MMAMFSVRFAYKISSTIFKYRPNNSKKKYDNSLLSAIVDRVELCLVKHMIFLLDRFGLFPTLREDLDIDNVVIREVVIVYSAYHKLLIPTALFNAVIDDDEREYDRLKADADVIIDKWDKFYQSGNRKRPLGIAWPLKPSDVKQLPPIALIIMAWGYYIGDRFQVIEDFLEKTLQDKPTMDSDELSQMILNNEALNMSRIFRGCSHKPVLLKQIKKNGAHAWGSNVIDEDNVMSCDIEDNGSFCCFEILSTKKQAYNIVDFASKLLQPTTNPSHFDSQSLIRTSTSIRPFQINIMLSEENTSVPLLSPGVLKKCWTTEDVLRVKNGQSPNQKSKSPKVTLQKDTAHLVPNLLALRSRGDMISYVDETVKCIDITYGSQNCEVQMVNIIKLQRATKCSASSLYDRNTYSVLKEYCTMKNLGFAFPHMVVASADACKAAFIAHYSAVRTKLIPLIDGVDSGTAVEGHASINVRKRDRSVSKERSRTPQTKRIRESSDSSSNDDDPTPPSQEEDVDSNNEPESMENPSSKNDGDTTVEVEFQETAPDMTSTNKPTSNDSTEHDNASNLEEKDDTEPIDFQNIASEVATTDIQKTTTKKKHTKKRKGKKKTNT
jgi:hypothetical protein